MVIAANFAKYARLKAGGRFVKFRACLKLTFNIQCQTL